MNLPLLYSGWVTVSHQAVAGSIPETVEILNVLTGLELAVMIEQNLGQLVSVPKIYLGYIPNL